MIATTVAEALILIKQLVEFLGVLNSDDSTPEEIAAATAKVKGAVQKANELWDSA